MIPASVPGYWLVISAVFYVAGLALVAIMSAEIYAGLPAAEKTFWRAALHVLRPLAWPLAIMTAVGHAFYLRLVTVFEMRTAMALEDLKERREKP